MLREIFETVLPENLAGRRKRGGAIGAEVYVDAIAIENRRRRCPALPRVDLAAIVGDLEYLDVDDFPYRRDVIRDRAQREAALFDRGGQPHLAVVDHGRRPAET